jgi:hypothetical protein
MTCPECDNPGRKVLVLRLLSGYDPDPVVPIPHVFWVLAGK